LSSLPPFLSLERKRGEPLGIHRKTRVKRFLRKILLKSQVKMKELRFLNWNFRRIPIRLQSLRIECKIM
jgi:hypothetical protein